MTGVQFGVSKLRNSRYGLQARVFKVGRGVCVVSIL
jgi:hypothetical protein